MSKFKPENREEFKELCLRRLGKPVIQINVSPDQVDDCVEESIKYYTDYHFDGSIKTFFKHEVTEIDKQRGYIPTTPDIMGITRIADSQSLFGGGMFDAQYQFALNNIHDIATGSVVPYYLSMEKIGLIEDMFQSKNPIRWNRNNNKLYIDINWDNVQVGTFIVAEAYAALDPDENPDIWNDRWLIKYCSAKIKYVWGSNMSKFDNISLPGGMTMNGTKIQDDSQAEIQALEDDMQQNYVLPPLDRTG